MWRLESRLVAQVGSSNSHVVVGIALLVVVLIISPVIIILVRKVTRTLQVSAVPRPLVCMADSPSGGDQSIGSVTAGGQYNGFFR